MKTTKPLFKQLHESQQMVKLLKDSLNDANKLNQELLLENLELESNILALKELFEKVLREHIALAELRDFYRNKISEL